MSIMNFRGSRFARATALVTLTAFLAGCLPQNQKDSAGSILDSANGLLGAVTSATSAIAETTGLDIPGAKKGYDNRDWTVEDQEAAERAKAVFSGKSADGLPVYNPTIPGEQARYQADIKRLVAKYGGRKDLTSAEMMEIARVVVPVARFIAQSRVYRDAKKNGVKVLKNPKGNSSVVIPAGMTVEMAMLTYCNDHGLPAPWSGEKLQFRSARAYMPEELFPIYQGLHTIAATNPSAHYRTQGLVWWLRDTPCKTERLSAADQQLLNSASPNAMGVLQTYCMKQKVKEYASKYAQQYIPAGAQGTLNQYQSLMAQAQDVTTKANAFLSADLTDPAQALQLAQSAGLTSKLGKNNFLDNKYLKQAMPLLNQSGLVKALVPNTAEDKSVAASLAAMEALGIEIGKTAGADKGSIANYSDLGNGLYAENVHSGGASNTAVRITNTSHVPQTITGSDYVLTTVQDERTGRASYAPTQRLSIGPMVPTKVYPNNPEADRIYTERNEQQAKSVLDELKDLDISLQEPEPEPSGEGEEQKKDCSLLDKLTQDKDPIIFGLGKEKIQDLIKDLPVVDKIISGYSVITGKDWFSGEELGVADYIDAVITLAAPPGHRTLQKVGTFLGKNGFRFARKAIINMRRSSPYKAYEKGVEGAEWTKGQADELTNAYETGYAMGSGDMCNAVSKAAGIIGSHGCKRSQCEIAAEAIGAIFEEEDENEKPYTPKQAMEDISSTLTKGADALKGFIP